MLFCISIIVANDQQHNVVKKIETNFMKALRIDLSIMKAYFRLISRRLYKKKYPGNWHGNQIDFVLINKKFQNAFTNCKKLIL